MQLVLSPNAPKPGANVIVSASGAEPGSSGVVTGGATPVPYTADSNGNWSVNIVAPNVTTITSVFVRATENADTAETGMVVTPDAPSSPSISALTATLSSDGKTVFAHCMANAVVRNVTLDEPAGVKLTEAAPNAAGAVNFPGVGLTPGLHTLSARGHTTPPGVIVGDTATAFISCQVTVPSTNPNPVPAPVNWWGSGKKLFMVSAGWIGSLAWAQKNAQATKQLGGTAMRSDVQTMAQADYLVQACRESGIKLFAIVGGSVASVSPTLGEALLAKYPNDLAGIELLNEPQTRISAPGYAQLIHNCVPPLMGKGVPICVGALNNSQGGSITPAARPWDWWNAVSVSYDQTFHAPIPGDILDWHWYLSWPGEPEDLAAVEHAHGVPSRPQIISETGISTYTGVGSYTAQASGLVADIKAQLANPLIVGYGLFQPYDMHAGDGQFADNLGVMGKPAQAAVATVVGNLRTSGVIA